MSTAIEWTDDVWNSVTGCSKVSEGCRHCYAEGVAHRFWGDRPFAEVRCHPDRLDAPLHWKKPRRIFVNSMSDLFHEDVPDEFIVNVYAAMVAASWHTFQVLTKRPERRRYLLSAPSFREWVARRAAKLINAQRGDRSLHATENLAAWNACSVRNIHEGVSIEDQKTADEHILILLQTPAAVRWISVEPLLGPVNLRQWVHAWGCPCGWVVMTREVIARNVDGAETTRAAETIVLTATSFSMIQRRVEIVRIQRGTDQDSGRTAPRQSIGSSWAASRGLARGRCIRHGCGVCAISVRRRACRSSSNNGGSGHRAIVLIPVPDAGCARIISKRRMSLGRSGASGKSGPARYWMGGCGGSGHDEAEDR